MPQSPVATTDAGTINATSTATRTRRVGSIATVLPVKRTLFTISTHTHPALCYYFNTNCLLARLASARFAMTNKDWKYCYMTISNARKFRDVSPHLNNLGHVAAVRMYSELLYKAMHFRHPSRRYYSKVVRTKFVLRLMPWSSCRF